MATTTVRPVADAASSSSASASASASASQQAAGQGLPDLSGRNPALDGLRGFGLLLVTIRHFSILTPLTLTHFLYLRLITPAWSALEIFFVLSGYLITGILWDTRQSPQYYRNFFMRRALRVFPLYFGTLLLCALNLRIIYPAGNQAFIQHLGWYLTYTYNLLVTGHGNYDIFDVYTAHLWSMGVEEQFYLAWPFLILLCNRRRFFMCCLAGFAISFLLRVLMLSLHATPLSTFVFTLTRLEGLTLGSMLAVAVRAPDTFSFVRRWARPVFKSTLLILAVILTARREIEWDIPWMQMVALPLFSILFTAGLAILILPGPRNPLKSLFSQRFFVVLGKYSYGIYIFQSCFRYSILNGAEWTIRTLPPLRILALHSMLAETLIRMALSLLFAFVIAFVVWHGYEKWFLRLKFLFNDKKKAAVKGV